ncbi:hypothetical protein BerOc1_01362 [Pseudodesulfovibrio hydrargyri]|uniref:Uncharacterized protein n=1 Tax=Pseudodesulfovibrio hydrargyri TaxID=2125990 RepID=A0A1J5MS48_9BACT|nr:hypothetical protein [Pseudodesulfovibrio hydrargyri]OIQ49437.1 hypothetical protein BerOc1_01362 [Pseudodesulfovibrio hydrargyri]
MSDKISMKAVAVDALRLMRLRAKVYLGGAVAGVIIALPLMLSFGSDGSSSGLAIAGWGVMLLLSPLVYMVVFHDSLMALRGTPKVLPARFVHRYLLVLWKYFLLALMTFSVAELCAVVLGAFIFMSGNVPHAISDIYIPVTTVVMSVSTYLLVRWGMALPAASVCDVSAFRRSWRMTRGHVLRMLLFALPYAVLVGVGVAVNLAAMRDRTFEPFSPAYLLYMVVGTAVFWYTFAAFTIWYERLRMRYESTLNPEQTGDSGEASMSKKISPFAVVKEAVALGWRRKWTFTGLVLAGFAPALLVLLLSVGMAASLATPGGAPGFGLAALLSGVVYILGLLFLATTTNHLAVTMQRGTGKAIPRPFWPAMGRVFVRGLILCLIFLGAALVVMVSLGAVAFSLLGDPAQPGISNPPALVGIILVGVVAYFLLLAFLLRLGVMLPGAAVGHVVKVREALALTRGHGWRMFWSLMMVSIPVAILWVIVQGGMVVGGPEREMGATGVLGIVLLLVIDLFSWSVLIAANAIWYEKLRLRAAGPGAGFGPAFEFETAPASHADPRAGSGVGPYADLPEEK